MAHFRAPVARTALMTLLDQSIIAEVRETLGDDAYRGFVDRMLAEASATAADLSALLQKGDLSAVAQTAHRSAGSAVSVGASGLHACLKEIEDEARGAASPALADLVARLPAVIDGTRDALARLLD
jgi:HPt (histidine-containing phosphotransfer) domain-containing protein